MKGKGNLLWVWRYLVDGLSNGLRCSLKRSLSHRLVSPMYCQLERYNCIVPCINNVSRVSVDLKYIRLNLCKHGFSEWLQVLC